VDYYGYLKPAWHAARRAFAPLAVAILMPGDLAEVYLMNDTLEEASGTLTLRQMTLDGRTLWERRAQGAGPANSSTLVLAVPRSEMSDTAGSFLRAEWLVGGETLAVNYFPELPKDVPFGMPDVTSRMVEENLPRAGGFVSKIELVSRNYSRFLHIEPIGMDVRGVTLSDDYFDMIPGERKTVVVETTAPLGEYAVGSLLDR
jgi:beta-mannosidase